MNGYNTLKYGATGIAAPDMSFYDRLRAEKSTAGLPVTTITGVPPISFLADSRPLTAWSIYGNVQHGETPTFCGAKTANLFDFNATDPNNGYVNGAYLTSDGLESENTLYRISEYIKIQGTTPYTLVYGNSLNNPSLCFYDSSKQYISGQKYGNNRTVTVTAPSNAKYIRISYTFTVRESVMLNDGDTALPHEPYGYKIPITCTGQTTTIYIGDPLRKAIDGTDAVDILYSTGTITRAVDADGNALETPTTQDIDVPLEIQTARGVNTLTVDTDLPPSSISITGHIKSV